MNKVCDSDGNTLETFEPKVRNTVDVLDTTQWNAIHTGMRMVVENLSTFDDFPIEVAGKTGTAQQSPNRPNHALFVGYAPYSDPEISIATRIAFGYTSHNLCQNMPECIFLLFWCSGCRRTAERSGRKCR